MILLTILENSQQKNIQFVDYYRIAYYFRK